METFVAGGELRSTLMSKHSASSSMPAGALDGDHALDDIELFALGTMTNSSPAMFERRRRILREARRMITTGPLEEFNIRELCRRADVSTRTIYNAFGGKEVVIALAIKAYFEAFHVSMRFEAPPTSFEGALHRQIATTMRNLDIPNYLHAVAALYFSPTAEPPVRQALLGIGQRCWLPWLQQLRIRRQLERVADVDRVATDVSDLLFAKVYHWGVGAFPDEELLGTTLSSALSYLAGVTRGEARQQVAETLKAMAEDGPDWRKKINEIRKWLDQREGRRARAESPKR
jgi:AcrR family transcriptional regulator